MLSINTYIKTLSYKYYLKNSELNTRNINRSVEAIIKKLFAYHDDELNEVFVFGSYSRGTILPRAYDIHSDVDIMVVFNHDEYGRTPDTYRNWLKEFAENNYNKAEIYKDHPTVVIRLNHINFDLVPAKYEEGWFTNSYYIPSNKNSWLKTKPHDFNDTLVKANKSYDNIVKPIIRLFKAWNANVGYPFQSYDIEKFIVSLDYEDMNIQEGFLYAIKKTTTSNSQTIFQNKSIENLKSNASEVRKCLKEGDSQKAKFYLHYIIPI